MYVAVNWMSFCGLMADGLPVFQIPWIPVSKSTFSRGTRYNTPSTVGSTSCTVMKPTYVRTVSGWESTPAVRLTSTNLGRKGKCGGSATLASIATTMMPNKEQNCCKIRCFTLKGGGRNRTSNSSRVQPPSLHQSCASVKPKLATFIALLIYRLLPWCSVNHRDDAALWWAARCWCWCSWWPLPHRQSLAFRLAVVGATYHLHWSLVLWDLPSPVQGLKWYTTTAHGSIIIILLLSMVSATREEQQQHTPDARTVSS